MKRQDKKGRNLQQGEYQDAKTGRYSFIYTDPNGKSCRVYSWCLTDTDKPPKGKSCDKCLRRMEEDIARDLMNKIDSKKARKITLDELFDDYIKLRTDGGELKNSTKQNYVYMYKKFISPIFGKKKVENIKRSDVKAFYNALIIRGFKPNSVDNVHTVLHPVLQMAVYDDIILKNPSDGVMADIKKSHNWEKPKRHALTEDHQSAFIDFVRNHAEYNHWLVLFTFLLGTGCRIGEALGLTWDDCDFEDGIIYINHNLVYRQNDDGHMEYHITTPKTDNGKRIIPMLDEVKQALQDEKLRQIQDGFCDEMIDGYHGFIFTNRFNKVQSPHNVNRAIDRIIRDFNEMEKELAKKEDREAIEIPHFSAHNLRHTFCTRFCEKETNVKIIQEIMGHADITTTMDIYNEATKDQKKKSFANLQGKVKIF